MTCETCRFAHSEWGHYEREFYCRRNPPSARTVTTNPTPVETYNNVKPHTYTVTYWPKVGVTDWCGEWQEKPADG
jgi:hypothetical protein